MRTVSGRTDRVVVVGAGLAGLSAALRLAGAGREVTVLERDDVPGGRSGLLATGGYRFDTGPTVLTMPELVEDALACVGETTADRLDLVRLDPAYRAFFADGSSLDVRADVEAMAAEVDAVCGPRDAAGYRAFVAHARALYDVQMRTFIDRNVDSPLDLLTPQLARLVAMGGFGRLSRSVRRFVRDPRLQRVLSFQSLYAGVSPQRALALYAVISYMDTVAGVWFPRAGMHAVPQALADAATAHGVRIVYGCPVERVELDGRRARAVVTGAGERVPCDAVVLTPDLPVAQRVLLGRDPWSLRRLRYSPSCLLLLAGSTQSYAGAAHHSILFGSAWREVFDDVVRDGRLMRDPSLLVSNPTRTDPDLAPPGRQSYYVLAPTPNTRAGLDWAELAKPYRDEVVRTLEHRGFTGFDAGIEVERLTTPADWAARGMAAGTPFAAAHTLTQTGPFRPRNLWGENVVFAGSGTTPGVGVPMVLVSGRLAAERVVGPDPSYRSRAWLPPT
jgi:phytoene desaturase